MRPAGVFEVYLPAKVLHSLSAEVPVLFGGSGEVSRLLRESGGGAVFDAGNGEQLRDLITERMMDPSIIDREGAAGRAYVVEHHDREVLAERFLALFRGVGSDRGGAP
jgi:glycosyltransferase involved in cell wall biosynthesis